MVDFTTRLGLIKPAGGENVDVDQLNANFDRLDAKIGAVICTSTTRPVGTDRYDGVIIQETDTGNVYIWSASQTRWVWLGGGMLGGITADAPDTVHNIYTASIGGYRAYVRRVRTGDRSLEISGYIHAPAASGGTLSPAAAPVDVAQGWADTADWPEWTRTNATTRYDSTGIWTTAVISGNNVNAGAQINVGPKGELSLRVQGAVTLQPTVYFSFEGVTLLRRQ